MTAPKVVYIAGWNRSGTTVLEQVLGQVDGWFHCGELRLLSRNLMCGCGIGVVECEFWRPVLAEVLGRQPHHLDLDAVAGLRPRNLDGGPRTLAAILSAHRGGPDGSSPVRRYAALLAGLYRAITRATAAQVLIDSSKSAADAYLIATFTNIDLYVVHLVRDPRATAFSWRRRKPLAVPGAYFRTMGPTRNSINWLLRNAAVEVFARPRDRQRYVRISYEEFARQPAAIAQSICSMVGEPEAELRFSHPGVMQLGANHTVGGNTVRFSRGEVRIAPDDEWKTGLDPLARALATIPALPLMWRYGYPILSRSTSG